MNEKLYNIILENLENIELSKSERKFIMWLAGWDTATAQNFIGIVRKCRKK